MRAQLLIADEPTTALDVTIQAQILELMMDLKEKLGMAIIMITHDLGIVARMCEKIAVMYAGKIVEYGTTDEIFYEPKHEYTKGLLRSIPRLIPRIMSAWCPLRAHPWTCSTRPRAVRSRRAARVHEGVPARDAAAHRFQRHALHAVLALPKGGV